MCFVLYKWVCQETINSKTYKIYNVCLSLSTFKDILYFIFVLYVYNYNALMYLQFVNI